MEHLNLIPAQFDFLDSDSSKKWSDSEIGIKHHWSQQISVSYARERFIHQSSDIIRLKGYCKSTKFSVQENLANLASAVFSLN